MIKPDLPFKDPNSHKGEKGKVIIVAGNHKYYGAPIITALAAESSGADLITMFMPQEHISTAKSYALNFFLEPFVVGNLGLKDIGLIIEAAKNNHAMVIGNGLGIDIDTQKAILYILAEINIPVVIDAEALIPEILTIKRKSEWLLTPHKQEFYRVFNIEATPENIANMAKKHQITIVVKGKDDIIASPTKVHINSTGCPQMRVGGTGDALAGIICSYIAQGMSPLSAAISACYYYGKSGEELATLKQSFTAEDLVRFYPEFLV
jgi:hydroxyethylthiazole kinase-like uncharacterized protein yjeF